MSKEISRFRMRSAQGNSMGPFYARAEHFLVDGGKRCPALGALVVYSGDHGEAAHRVVLKFRWGGKLWLVTKGDANAFVDRPMAWERGIACRVWALNTTEGLVSLKGMGERKRAARSVLSAWAFIAGCKLTGKSPLA